MNRNKLYRDLRGVGVHGSSIEFVNPLGGLEINDLLRLGFFAAKVGLQMHYSETAKTFTVITVLTGAAVEKVYEHENFDVIKGYIDGRVARNLL